MRHSSLSLVVSAALLAIAGGCGKNGTSGPVQSTPATADPQQPCKETPRQCTARALVHLRSNRPNRGPAYAASLLRIACDSRDLEACTHLGRITITGWGASQDTAAGVALLTSSCSRGEPLACQLQTVFVNERAERERLHHRAHALWQEQCDGGNRDACGLLGVALLTAGEEPTDRIRQLLSTGCDAGEPGFCGHLANATVPRPETLVELEKLAPIEKSIRLLEGECEKDAPVGCAELANVHGMLGHSNKAYAASDKACSLGDTPSCLEVATQCSEHGDCEQRHATFCTAGGDLYVCSACLEIPRLCGVDLGTSETMRLLGLACDEGVGDACFQLAESSNDPASSAQLYRRACAHASSRACTKIAETAPAEAATELRQRACLLGEPTACDGASPLPR